MADGAENYEVTTRQTFVNGLVSGLTFGIYTPTTTKQLKNKNLEHRRINFLRCFQFCIYEKK
jgi:hypothetical protein